MDPLPVTIIVKAPNQQFEDQTIKCEPTWSIRKLKGYLTEVYPCNPVSRWQLATNEPRIEIFILRWSIPHSMQKKIVF